MQYRGMKRRREVEGASVQLQIDGCRASVGFSHTVGFAKADYTRTGHGGHSILSARLQGSIRRTVYRHRRSSISSIDTDGLPLQ